MEITEVDEIANFYRVSFRVLGYPTFSQTFSTQYHEFEKINTISKQILSQRNIKEHAVVSDCLNMVNSRQDDAINDNANWLKIAIALASVPQYASYYFFKCSAFFIDKNKFCPFENDLTILEEGKCAYLKIEYYQKQYDATNDSKIDVHFNEKIIGQSLGLRTKIDARYDSIVLGFQPLNTMNETHSEIIICTAEERGKLQTEISLPIMIVKRKSSLIWKSLIMSAGALLVGLPALLPGTLDVQWKIIISFVGACIMGVNHFINLKGK